MNIGVHINKLIDEDNYAYKMELFQDVDETDKLVKGLKIFKPYYLQYQSWRDTAIRSVEHILKEKKDAVILSLDVKEYFHSVQVDFDKLEEDLSEIGFDVRSSRKMIKLFDLIPMINELYKDRLNALMNDKFDFPILPIGLLSSGVLANYYLTDFDKNIKKSLSPAYYGRYVDDIMMVLTDVQVSQNSISPVNRFLNDYFVERGLLSFKLPIDPCENSFLDTSSQRKNGVRFVDVSLNDDDLDEPQYYKYLYEASK